MEYKGKLYGKVGNMLLPLENTTDDFERMEKEISELKAKVEKPIPTDEQIEAYALENILDGVGIQSMKNTKVWIAGATWMRDLIRERRIK